MQLYIVVCFTYIAEDTVIFCVCFCRFVPGGHPYKFPSDSDPFSRFSMIFVHLGFEGSVPRHHVFIRLGGSKVAFERHLCTLWGHFPWICAHCGSTCLACLLLGAPGVGFGR